MNLNIFTRAELKRSCACLFITINCKLEERVKAEVEQVFKMCSKLQMYVFFGIHYTTILIIYIIQ